MTKQLKEEMVMDNGYDEEIIFDEADSEREFDSILSLYVDDKISYNTMVMNYPNTNGSLLNKIFKKICKILTISKK